MGEGTTRIESPNGSSARVRELGSETEAMRRQLDELVMELDRRRHQAFDWRLQLRRHGRALVMIGGGVAVLVAIGVATSMARSRRQRTLATRLTELADREGGLRRVLERILDDPNCLPAEAPRTRGRVDRSMTAAVALETARAVLPYVAGSLARRVRHRRPSA